MKVSAQLTALGDSPTLAVGSKAKEMIAAGRDVISLALGEPDFETPQHIIEAGVAAMRGGDTRYTATQGTQELRRSIAERQYVRRDIPLGPGDIVVSTGAKQALYNLFQALLDPGDEVLLPLPCWVSYPAFVQLAGGRSVGVPTTLERGFRVSADALREAVTPQTRAVVLNSPNNPSGACLQTEDLQAISEVAQEHDLAIVSDEVYQALVYEGASAPSPAALGPEVAARTYTISGVSKAWSMTGWRIGWLATPDRDMIGAVTRLQSHSTSNPCSIAQAAALAALEGPEDFRVGWLEQFDRRRREVVRRLEGMPGVTCATPQGAFYVFPSVEGLLGEGGLAATDEELALRILEEAAVATVPGSAFGCPGHLRLSYALSFERLQEALQRMERFLAQQLEG